MFLMFAASLIDGIAKLPPEVRLAVIILMLVEVRLQ